MSSSSSSSSKSSSSSSSSSSSLSSSCPSFHRERVAQRIGLVPTIRCDMRRVKWCSCTSTKSEVVHFQVGNRTWIHSEHVGLQRFTAVREGRLSLRRALRETAAALLSIGAWSEAVQHMRISLISPTFQEGSYVTVHAAPRARSKGVIASQMSRVGWVRLDARPKTPVAKVRADVEQIVFFASSVDMHTTDGALLKWYGRQLQSRAQLWLLLLHSVLDAPVKLDKSVRDHPIFLWSERALQLQFPQLAKAVSNSIVNLAQEPISNHARYFFYHSTLLLWYRNVAHDYPKLRFFWRIEPDAVYMGNLQTLINVSAQLPADVLLPEYLRHRQSPGYPHWGNNKHVLSRVPKPKWMWALVSIGRYSKRFITDFMLRSWATGVVAYEEIGIPVICVTEPGCTLASFPKGAPLGAHIRYKPTYQCEEALRARMRCRNEIWHPVKDRACLIQFLEEAGASSRYACAGAGVAYRTDVVVGLPRRQADGRWVVDNRTDPRAPRRTQYAAPLGLWVGDNWSKAPREWASARWLREVCGPRGCGRPSCQRTAVCRAGRVRVSTTT